MKIVLVGQYYWPDNFLINDIAEEMVQRGHQVTVLTGLPDYATSKVPPEFKFGKRRHETRNGVEIFRVPIIARHHGFIMRVLNYFSFCISSSIFARIHKFDADIIMAYQTAPVLMANAAIVLKKKLKKPLFFYCLDIWPDQMKVWGVNEKFLMFKIMNSYCKYAYGNGDIVGITSMPFKNYLIDINDVDPEKIAYLPQHSVGIGVVESEKHENGKINLVFAGNIGEQQNIECLLKAIAVIKTDKEFIVHIYGDGTSFDKCIQMVDDLRINDYVLVHGRVTKEKLYSIYPKMDAFLLTLCSEKQIGFVANTVPAKFQDYLSAGKPIIASIDGGAKEIIEQTKCGLVCEANNPEEYAKIITKFIKNPEKYSKCGSRGKKYFDRNYRKELVMNQLENYLIELSKRNNNG